MRGSLIVHAVTPISVKTLPYQTQNAAASVPVVTPLDTESYFLIKQKNLPRKISLLHVHLLYENEYD